MEPFRDNWSYLKVEMNWLERILLNAVAKARAVEAKTNRHAKTAADRASRDWWMGLMNFEKVGYDSPPPKANLGANLGVNPGSSASTSASASAKPTLSYHQQLEARIRQSQAVGVQLVLPELCDRYGLSLFERQAVVLAIAPEVHRRYGELCGYLSGQTSQVGGLAGLPTVDLALRLFCRDDQAWRLGRSQLLSGPLATEGLLVPGLLTAQSFLQQPLKLNPYWVSELLGGGNGVAGNGVVGEPSVSPIGPIRSAETTLSAKLKTQVKRTTTRLKTSPTPGSGLLCIGLDRLWSSDPEDWVGFYSAIAKPLKMQPYSLDLAVLNLRDLSPILQGGPIDLSIAADSPKLLVIRSAGRLLSRNSPLTQVEKVQFIRQMRSDYDLVLLETSYPIALEQVWRSWIRESFTFPLSKV